MNNKINIIINTLSTILVSILIFAFLPTEVDVFISAYMFLLIAILVEMITVGICINKQEVSNKIACYSMSIIYTIIQAVVSLVAIISYPKSVVGTVAISSCLLLLYIIIFVIMLYVFSMAENREIIEKSKIIFINKIACDLETYKQNVMDEEILDTLSALIENVKYSDIMSSEKLKDVETRIEASVDCLETLLKNNDINEIKNTCDKINKLLKERNAKCKLYK